MKEKKSNVPHPSMHQNEFDETLDELNQFSYDEVLKEEREITMNLSFEDFLLGAEQKKQVSINEYALKPKRIKWKIWSGIAACGLIVLGSIAALHSEEKLQNKPMVEVVEHQLKIHEQEQIDQEINSNPASKIENHMVAAPKKTKNIESLDYKNKERTILPSNEQELVVVNGEVITDEEQAEEIAIETLKLLAKNLNKGNDAVHQLKHLSIEL